MTNSLQGSLDAGLWKAEDFKKEKKQWKKTKKKKTFSFLFLSEKSVCVLERALKMKWLIAHDSNISQRRCCRWRRDCQNVPSSLSLIIAQITRALCQSTIIYIWEGIVLDSKSNQAISHSDQMSQAARFILKAEKRIRTPGYCIPLQ